MTLTSDSTKVIAGGAFSTLGTRTELGMGALSAKSGSVRTWKINKIVKDWGPNSGITSLRTQGKTIYGGSYTYGSGNFEGAFAASATDGAVRWLQDCHGDTYDVAPVGDIVYSVGHAHYCRNIGGFPDTKPRSIWNRALAVTRTPRGTVAKNGQPTYWGGTRKYGNFPGQPAPSLYDWFPDVASGNVTGLSQGAWSVVGNKSYISLGGEFPTVNGVAQQGLARLAVPKKSINRQGPVDHSSVVTPTAVAEVGKATLSWLANWDRDDIRLTYRLVRTGDDGNRVVIDTQRVASMRWNRPTLTFVDTTAPLDTAARYTVTVSDPDGNTLTTAAVKVTVPSA
jgi:hypothetical protein